MERLLSLADRLFRESVATDVGQRLHRANQTLPNTPDHESSGADGAPPMAFTDTMPGYHVSIDRQPKPILDVSLRPKV